MRLVTYSVGAAGPPRAGVRAGHRVLDIEAASRVKGEPLPSSLKALLVAGRGAFSRVQALAKAATTEARSLSQAMHEERAIRILPPVPDAEKFLRLEDNDRSHAREAVHASPAATEWPVSGFVGHEARIAVPPGGGRLECNPELVFVIGRRAQDARDIDPADFVAGVTVLTRFAGWQRPKKKEKGSSSSAAEETLFSIPSALGPEIVTLDEIADPYDLWLTCFVNGEERLRVNTREHLWQMPEIIEHFSRQHAVEPGDMFCTGEIRGSGEDEAGAAGRALKAGDVVECSIEGIAVLRTTLAAPGDS